MSSEFLKAIQPMDMVRPREAAVPVRQSASGGAGGSEPPGGGKAAAAPGGTLPVGGQVARGREVEKAVSSINDYVQHLQRDLQFSVDKDSGRTIIKVIDSETKEVIRQIPPEEALALSRELRGSEGLILKARA